MRQGFDGKVTEPNLVSNLPPLERQAVSEAVYMLNAIEKVEVKLGTGSWVQSATLSWFSVTWLEKSKAGWRRKPDIERHQAGLDSELGVLPPNLPQASKHASDGHIVAARVPDLFGGIYLCSNISAGDIFGAVVRRWIQ